MRVSAKRTFAARHGSDRRSIMVGRRRLGGGGTILRRNQDDGWDTSGMRSVRSMRYDRLGDAR